MSKSLKYVSDFQFPSECGFTGSTGKTMVKGYARGGHADVAKDKAMVKQMAKADVTKDKAMIKSAVHKHEKSLHKGEALTKMAHGGYAEGGAKKAAAKDAAPARKQYPTNRSEPMIKAMSGGMLKDRSKLGIEGNKNPGETKKHTAPDLPGPKTMMKSGGSVRGHVLGAEPKPAPGSQPRPTQVNPVRPGQPMPERPKVVGPKPNPGNPVRNISPAVPSEIQRTSTMMQAAQMQPSGGAAPRTQSGMMQAAQMQRPGGMAKGGMTPKQEAKVGKVMGEYKAGDLHSGSKSGPMVKSRKQAIAIAMSEAGKKRK